MKKFKEIWYAAYQWFISLSLALICLLCLSTKEIIFLLQSKNAPGAFGAVITFTSILIGFVGVLLTAIVSIKRESELIQYFLKKADKRVFSNLISRNIISGIGLALVSAVLFFTDGLCSILIVRDMSLCVVSGVFCLWIFLLSYFVLSTYKLMHLLLTMLIRSDEKKPTLEDPEQLSKEEEAALKARHTSK